MAKTLVLFTDDLRMHDHPALWHAAQRGQVMALYRLQDDPLALTAADLLRRHALVALHHDLQKHGVTLHTTREDLFASIMHWVRLVGIDAVYFHDSISPFEREQNAKLKADLRAQGLEVASFAARTIFSMQTIQSDSGKSFQVFTPFWRKAQLIAVEKSYPKPAKLEGLITGTTSLDDPTLLLQEVPTWAKKLTASLNFGETTAIQAWQTFREERLLGYRQGRDYPAQEAVSRLSMHLACGSLSAKALYRSAEVTAQATQDETLREACESYQRQLLWREFAYDQWYQHKMIDRESLRQEFQSFPWLEDEESYQAWCQGRTGYPLVDAGMRELWQTGYMHNRVRMVVGSFLVKDLLLSWTKGYEWFKKTLFDFDVANNALGWQWVAGTGIDAAPYFRVFNPVLQSQKFDEKATYIRRYVTELRALTDEEIHAPWKVDRDRLRQAGVILGETYPYPIVDHAFARDRALAAYEQIKKRSK